MRQVSKEGKGRDESAAGEKNTVLGAPQARENAENGQKSKHFRSKSVFFSGFDRGKIYHKV